MAQRRSATARSSRSRRQCRAEVQHPAANFNGSGSSRSRPPPPTATRRQACGGGDHYGQCGHQRARAGQHKARHEPQRRCRHTVGGGGEASALVDFAGPRGPGRQCDGRGQRGVVGGPSPPPTRPWRLVVLHRRWCELECPGAVAGITPICCWRRMRTRDSTSSPPPAPRHVGHCDIPGPGIRPAARAAHCTQHHHNGGATASPPPPTRPA